MKSSELKQLIKEEIVSILNESDISTYERREEEAKNFADKNFDSVSFMGYGFNELAPESFKGEFKIRSGEDFDEAMKIKDKDIATALQLPPIKLHCSVLAEETIQAAVKDWEEKHKK